MNWNISQTDNVNSLLLVAHPDDETIFCGGTLLTFPAWNWTVICMTSARNSERYIQFTRAMEYFKALGVRIITHSTLEQLDMGQDLSAEEETQWRNLVNNLSIDPNIVFTHNTEGEYGHFHHKSLNKIVKEHFSNVWEFICPGAVNVAPQPFREKVNTVPLTMDILNKKTEIFNRCYTTELACWKVLPEIMQFEFRNGPEIFTSD